MTALAPFFVGLIIGTLYYMVFAVVEGTGSRLSTSRRHAVFVGAISGAGGVSLAWALQSLIQSASLSVGTGLFSLLAALGAGLGSVGPALIAFDGREPNK